MITVTTRYLAPLATLITHKPCRVEIGHHLPYGINGSAGHDGKEFVIHLHPALLEMQEVAEVARVFWHECAHIALGHVAAQRTVSSPAELLLRLALSYSDKELVREEQADAWAAQVRSEIPDRDLWSVICR